MEEQKMKAPSGGQKSHGIAINVQEGENMCTATFDTKCLEESTIVSW